MKKIFFTAAFFLLMFIAQENKFAQVNLKNNPGYETAANEVGSTNGWQVSGTAKLLQRNSATGTAAPEQKEKPHNTEWGRAVSLTRESVKLENSGFEKGVLEPWSRYGYASRTYEVVSENPHSGNYCLKIIQHEHKTSYLAQNTEPLEAGAVYKISVWIRWNNDWQKRIKHLLG